MGGWFLGMLSVQIMAAVRHIHLDYASLFLQVDSVWSGGQELKTAWTSNRRLI